MPTLRKTAGQALSRNGRRRPCGPRCESLRQAAYGWTRKPQMRFNATITAMSVMLPVKCFAVIGSMVAVTVSTVPAPAIIAPMSNIWRVATFDSDLPGESGMTGVRRSRIEGRSFITPRR
jgi:hypothetical protein